MKISLKRLSRFPGPLLCTVINIGVLLVGGVFWILVKEGISEVGAMVFGVTKEELKVTFLRIFMEYRAAILVLNLVPYIALKIMT